LSRVVLVGDRGMLTQPQIDKMKLHPGFTIVQDRFLQSEIGRAPSYN